MQDLLDKAQGTQCSDVHLITGRPPLFRVLGELRPINYEVLTIEKMRGWMNAIMSDIQRMQYNDGLDVDTAYADQHGNRYRVNVYRQQGLPCIAIRLLRNRIPTLDELHMPSILARLSEAPRGLVLVTGPTGSGKSTTLAAMINHINKTRYHHILTLEDPLEYLHKSDKSLINQREIHRDVNDFASGLRSALREDPDVILVGEMRDHETISLALTAAETGHLVFSTLHTLGAAPTIDRIIDVFPPHQQSQIRTQLASSLNAVISQALIPMRDRTGRISVQEIMVMTDAIGNLIRENKIVQINTAIQTGLKLDMTTMELSLAKLVNSGIITLESATDIAPNKELLNRYL